MVVTSFQTTQSFLIGATSEFNNYSVGTTDEGMDWLLRHAYHRVPQLKDSHILKKWSGVRPYTEKKCQSWIKLMMAYT